LDESLPAQLIGIGILLLFSAFFSGAETAFFSINYITLERIKNKKDKRLHLIYKLLKNPNELLITILIGNMIVNIFASAIASALTLNLMKELGVSDIIGMSISIIVMTLTLLYFGEISPKLISINKPLTIAKYYVYPIIFFIYLFKPLSFFFRLITDFITSKIIKTNVNEVKDEDIESIINISHKEGVIDKDEKDMFKNIYNSIGKEVQEIMQPKTKMFLIDGDKTITTIIKSVIKSRYNSIPVYKKSKDNIIGIIYKKDILPIKFKLNKIKDIKELIKPILFIPEGKSITGLLRDFQNEKVNFAIVVDEFGNYIGFITLDDLIEEIVGEYNDEYDREEKFYHKINDLEYKFKGYTKIEDFNKIFNVNYPVEDYTTLNGFLLDKFKRIPEKGEKFDNGKFTFIIDKVRGPKIDLIKVKLKK